MVVPCIRSAVQPLAVAAFAASLLHVALHVLNMPLQTSLPQACCPNTGEELCISYGDKGNEELLLLYGFALPANHHETLMLLCPLPAPDDWDEVFTARMQLLQVRMSGEHVQNILSCQLLVSVDGSAAS
jgi:hypothetical protein